jgi:hypothetical protein
MAANQVPAFLLDLPSQGIAERTLPHLGGMSPPYVSIMGGRFTLVDAAGDSEEAGEHDKQIGVYLDAVIVDSLENESKIYYAKPFDPNSQSYAPPDCWSDNGIAPSRLASLPQAKTCTPDPSGQHGCQKAVWGSATSRVSGKGVPACSKYQKLALALPGDDIVYLLRVPPNSLSNLQAYLAKFRGQTLGQGGPPLGPEHVVTRIWFEKDVLGTLMFRAVGYIDQPMAEFQRALRAEKKTDGIVGRGDQPIAALAAPAGGQVSAQEAPRPLPALSAAAPAALTAGTQSSQAQPAGDGGATTASPTRRRRRTAAEMAAAAAPEPAAAPFRPQADTAPNGPGAPFGVGDPSPMTQELNQTLDSFFGKS